MPGQKIDTSHPFIKGALTFLYNKLLERYEPTWSYENHEEVEEYIRAARRDFEYSLGNGAHFVDGRSSVDMLWVAFERFTRNERREYMLMGIGGVNEDRVASVSVQSGSETFVAWPAAGIRELRRRVELKQPCRLVAIHNHPYGLLHKVLGLAGLGLPGASEQDREELMRWLGNERCKELVNPEFYLIEGQMIRKIRFPSWEFVLSTVQSMLGTIGHPLR